MKTILLAALLAVPVSCAFVSAPADSRVVTAIQYDVIVIAACDKVIAAINIKEDGTAQFTTIEPRPLRPFVDNLRRIGKRVRVYHPKDGLACGLEA